MFGLVEEFLKDSLGVSLLLCSGIILMNLVQACISKVGWTNVSAENPKEAWRKRQKRLVMNLAKGAEKGETQCIGRCTAYTACVRGSVVIVVCRLQGLLCRCADG